jgi:hypothetical protein
MQLATLIRTAPEIEFQAVGEDTATSRRIVVSTRDPFVGYVLQFGFDHAGDRTITTTTSARNAALAVADLLAYLASMGTLGRIFGDEATALLFDPNGTPELTEGRVGLLTLSGTIYEIDIGRMELRRQGARLAQSHATFRANQLRRDDETIKVIRLAQLQLGKPAVFVLEPLGDPRVTVATTRTTTSVLLILRLTPARTAPGGTDQADR